MDRYEKLKQAGENFLSDLETMENKKGFFVWEEIEMVMRSYANTLSEIGIRESDTINYFNQLLDQGMKEALKDENNSNGLEKRAS